MPPSKQKTTKKPSMAPLVSESDDTDLEYDEDVLLRRIHKDRSDCRRMYEAACRHYDVITSSQFISHMKGSRVQLTDQALGALDIKAMCIPLLYNTTVSVIDFSGNNLGNKGVVHVMDMLKENVKIEQLHLSRNNISRSGVRYICSGLSSNHKIRVLNLSGNLLRDSDSKYIADLLRSNSIIKVLDLSSNQLGETSGHILGQALCENGALEELDVSWNHIRLNGAVALARALRDNDTLRRLDVSWNGFTNEGAAELGEALSENFSLKELNLNSNRINLVGLSKLARGINTNEGLKTLKLGGNPILAIGAEMILQVIQQSDVTKMEELDIEHVPVSYNFVATLEALNQESGSTLQVKHDCKIRHADDLAKQPGCLEADPYRVVMMYVKERDLNLTDYLVPCPESAEMCVDEMPFRAAIRRLNPPLNEIQVEGLSKRLHKFTDENEFLGVDISTLVNPGEYREKRVAYLARLEAQTRASQALDDYRLKVESPSLLPENTTLAVHGRDDVTTPADDVTDAAPPSVYADKSVSDAGFVDMSRENTEVGSENELTNEVKNDENDENDDLPKIDEE